MVSYFCFGQQREAFSLTPQSSLLNVVACPGSEQNNMNEAIRTPVTPFSITDILNRDDVPQQNNNSLVTWSQNPVHTHPVSPTYLPLPTYFQGALPIHQLGCYKTYTASQIPTALPPLCGERKPEENAEREEGIAKVHSKLYSITALELRNGAIDGFLGTELICLN